MKKVLVVVLCILSFIVGTIVFRPQHRMNDTVCWLEDR